MNRQGVPERRNSGLLLIDVQERLMPVIHQKEGVISAINKLLSGMKLLKIPIWVTEQYPKGLGTTDQRVNIPAKAQVVEKIHFSGLQDNALLKSLKSDGIENLVICGVETHICVLQTALDALDAGFNVHVVADAVGSRFPHNRDFGIERIRQSGAFIVTVEMILFQLLSKAGSQEFRTISNLIK